MTNAAVLTISDSSSAGKRPDKSGPAVRERLEHLGWSVSVTEIIPDEAARSAIRLRPWRMADRSPRFSPRAAPASPKRCHPGSYPRRTGPRNSRLRRIDARPRPGKDTPGGAFPLAGGNARACTDCELAGFAKGCGGIPGCYRGVGSPRAGILKGRTEHMSAGQEQE